MFQNRLLKVYRHTGRQARRQGISCFRVYDHDIPEFPFCIEVYEKWLYLAEYKRNHGMSDEDHEAWLDQCIGLISSILQVPVESVYVRQRQRKAGRLGQYEKLDHTESFFEVSEAGLLFKVNLSDYLDTGLFLDHRITRQMVREQSQNKKVLNLFCYTGSFSVYAAAGGAAEVVSVDLSKTYLNWAKENMELNKFFDPKIHQFIHADVKQYLDDLPPDYFDLVVMDPPTFSNSKRMKDFLDIQRDHAALLNKVLQSMKPGGILYFSTNYRRFQLAQDSINASLVKDITPATTPFDFQGKLFRWCYQMIR